MLIKLSIRRWALLGIVFLTAVSIVKAQENAYCDVKPGQNATVNSVNGFVVWAEGSGCDRELKFNKIVDGKVGEKQTAVEKGVAADIHVHISYDGVWIAFSRAAETFDAKYGQCDYHIFDNFDVYIAKIDNGKNLPAKAIKVAHGYWTSWGEDATNPDGPKTLYYSNYQGKCVMKTIIQPDGSFSEPVKHAPCPGKMTHTQISPDGEYIAYRPGRLYVGQVSTGQDVPEAGGSGCHPCWGPRSKYLIWSRNNVCRIEDGKTTLSLIDGAGVGSYWQGISNDAFYDEGRLWIIARYSGAKGQNDAGSVEFREVDISNGGWVPGPTTKVGEGTACDIHIYGPEKCKKKGN